MIPALVPLVLEAALRALLAAAAVWAGLRLLRVGNVLVQKAAWALVLVAALAMPLAPRWQILPTFGTLRLPALLWNPTSSPVLASPRAAVATGIPSFPSALENSRTNAGTPQAAASASDRYPAPAISNTDFSSRAWSDAPASSAYDAAPDASEPPSQLETESESASPGLKGTGLSLNATNPGLKGTGARAYKRQPGKRVAPAPEGPRPQADSLPAASAIRANVATPNQLPQRIAVFAWALYLGVVGALLLRFVHGLVSALRIWSAAVPVLSLPDGGPTSGLRASPRVASPVNIGSGIVVPADYAAWDEEKLRIVLAHERSHVRQGDFYLQLLAGVYASLFWFSPLGWWLKRKLTELSEAISDRAGLEEADSRSSYAQLLLEFAALPRPTLTGVAMARTSHLAQRIERLLNETSFRQAFAAGGRRALLAVLLVPVALFSATALVRVEAAATPALKTQPAVQDQTAGQSTPEQVTDQAAPAPATALAPAAVPAQAPAPSPAATPEPISAGDPGPAPMAPLPPNPAIEAMPPLPPMPQVTVRIPKDAIHVRIDPSIAAEIAVARDEAKRYRAYAYASNGDAYALVGDPGTKARFNGVWDGNRTEEIEKARKIAHGHFLWFRHEGKSYIVDDPAVVAQVEAMNKPMDDLGKQMRELGDQMRDLGKQQRELGKQMRDITVPTPDISKQIAEMNAAFASFQAKQGATISQKELSDLQRELGRLQGELGALQGKIGAQQAGLGSGMGKFGEQQGKLGGEMGKLGDQMGQLGRENQSKIKSIIDQSLSNGKARPVE